MRLKNPMEYLGWKVLRPQDGGLKFPDDVVPALPSDVATRWKGPPEGPEEVVRRLMEAAAGVRAEAAKRGWWIWLLATITACPDRQCEGAGPGGMGGMMRPHCEPMLRKVMKDWLSYLAQDNCRLCGKTVRTFGATAILKEADIGRSDFGEVVEASARGASRQVGLTMMLKTFRQAQA